MTRKQAAPDHPACSLPEPERVAYLTIIASLVYADQNIDRSELDALDHLCATLGVTGPAAAEVRNAAEVPDVSRVRAIAAKLKKDDLRFTLMTDAVVMVFADAHVAPQEAAAIAELARLLGITAVQVGQIAKFVETAVAAPSARGLGRELADGVLVGAHTPGSIRGLWKRLRRK